ncbi:S-layer homology domain-containing protein [Paenibacillus sp. Marseille-Q9583]
MIKRSMLLFLIVIILAGNFVYCSNPAEAAVIPQEANTADITALSSNTLLYQNFELGNGFSSPKATLTDEKNRDHIANQNGTTSMKMVSTTGGDWPNNTQNYVDITPVNGAFMDVSAYKYLIYYIKDVGKSGNMELTITDSSGRTTNLWTDDKSVSGEWTKIVVPFSSFDPNSKLDLSKVAKVTIGQWDKHTLYIDDMYFAKNKEDILPGFISKKPEVKVEWYQNFEHKKGFVEASGVTATVDTLSSNEYGKNSLKVTIAEDSEAQSVNHVTITPQLLGASLDAADSNNFGKQFDATNYEYLIFYVYDAVGGNPVSVTIKDVGGKSWNPAIDTLTQNDQWTRVVVNLDKSKFNVKQINGIQLGSTQKGTYYYDELYFASSDAAEVPGFGFTTLVYKAVGGDIIPYQNGVPLASFEKQKDRDYLSLNGEWNKQRVTVNSTLSAAPRDAAGISAIEAESGNRFAAQYDDSAWSNKTLPLPENDRVKPGADKEVTENDSFEDYQGAVWYRKHCEPDASWTGQNVKLSFLGVNYFADVWVNGVYAGGHAGGYTPFGLDVSSLLKYGEDNVIAVRVDNPKWDFFSKGEILPYVKSDWFNYTGVLRDIYLEASDDVYVVRSDIKPLNEQGDLNISTILNNKRIVSDANVDLTYQVFEAKLTNSNQSSDFSEDLISGAAVASKVQSVKVNANSAALDHLNLQVPNPKLWSPAEPNLYVLKVTKKLADGTSESYYTQFGIRTLSTEGATIMLNGKPAPFLVGMGRSEDSFDKGPSLTHDEIYKDFSIIKNQFNANFVRTGHLPNHINSYMYTDRLGLAVWQEIPAFWFSDDGFNGTRQTGMAKQMFSEMIYSNYNRPSVWFDGTTNESGGNLTRINYIQDLYDTAYEIDGTRLVAQSAVSNKYMGQDDNTHTVADVVGMTMYYGIFYGENADMETRQSIEDLHAMYPDKPILATEYGYWSGPDGAQGDKQVQFFNSTFNAFASKATVNEDGTPNPDGIFSGAAWWTAFNWYSNVDDDGGHIQSMGLMHMNRKDKKKLTDILSERYGRYTKKSTVEPLPVGLSEFYQNFESGNFYSVGPNGKAVVSKDSANANGTKSVQWTVTDSAYLAVAPADGMISKDLTYANYLNLYVKADQGNVPTVGVTLVDTNGKSWSGIARETAVKGGWSRLTLPLGSAVKGINNLFVKEIQLEVGQSGVYYVDDLYLTTYENDPLPVLNPIGNTKWYQNLEDNAEAVVIVGSNTTATIEKEHPQYSNGVSSVRMEITGEGGYPGRSDRNVTLLPQEGSVFDSTGYDYLSFYVKDMSKKGNTVNVVLQDANGVIADGWTESAGIGGAWTKVSINLRKIVNNGLDFSKITSISLGEWNPGVYYFDDVFFAQYATDGIPAEPSTDKTLTSLSITGPSTMYLGEADQQMKLIANYSDNTTVDVTAEAKFTSSKSEVATISKKGLISAISVGSAEIKAEFAEQVALFSLTVQAAKVPLGILTGPAEVTGGQPLDLTFKLVGVTESVYLKEVTFNYDPTHLKFVQVDSLIDGVTVDTQTDESGIVKVQLMSTDPSFIPRETGDLLNIHFQTESVAENTTSSITPVNVTVSNLDGSEMKLSDGPLYQVQINKVPVDKSPLISLIDVAQAKVAAAVVGTVPGQYSQAAVDRLNKAIQLAHAIANNILISQMQVDQALTELKKEMEAFAASVITAPPVVNDNTNNNNKGSQTSNLTIKTGLIEIALQPNIGVVTVTEADFQKAVKTVLDGNLTIQVISQLPFNTVTVKLPVKEITGSIAIGELKKLTLNMGLASVKLSKEQLLELTGDQGKEIQLTVRLADLSELSGAMQKKFGSNPLLDFTLKVDGITIKIFKAKHGITLALPYTLKKDEKPETVVAYHINDDGNVEVIRHSRYDANAKEIVFETNHFSYYAAAYARSIFRDIDKLDWARTSIEALAAREIVKGTDDSTFNPDVSVTRAEFVKMLMLALNLKVEHTSSSFTDVKAYAWYTDYIGSAQALGIVEGKSDGSFGIHDPISRQDISVMTYRAAQMRGTPFEGGEVNFTDVNLISEYAKASIGAMQKAEILTGFTDGSFAPRAQTTRAQAAVMIYKLFNQ